MLYENKPKVAEYLRACLGVPSIGRNGVTVPQRIAPEFAEMLACLDDMLLPGGPLPHPDVVDPTVILVAPERTMPNRYRLAMAEVLYVTEVGVDAFDHRGKLDIEAFRRFLLRHLDRHDVYRLGIPMTPEENARYLSQVMPAPEFTAFMKKHRPVMRNMPDATVAMAATLVEIPRIRVLQRHAGSLDVAVGYVEMGAFRPMVVSVPLRAYFSSLSPDLQRHIAHYLPPRDRAQLFAVSRQMRALMPAGEDLPRWDPRTAMEWGRFWRAAKAFGSLHSAKAFEDWYGRLRSRKALTEEFCKCVEAGWIQNVNIHVTARLIQDESRTISVSDLLAARLIDDACAKAIRPANLKVWATRPAILALAAGFRVSAADLGRIEYADMCGAASVAGLIEAALAETASKDTQRILAVRSGLPFADAINAGISGLDDPACSNFQKLLTTLTDSRLRALGVVLDALNRVRPAHVAKNVIANLLKAVIDLPDQEKASAALPYFAIRRMVLPRVITRNEETGDLAYMPILAYTLVAKKFALAEQLLASVSNVNDCGTDGRSALHIAAAAGKTVFVRRLLDKGARIDMVDDTGCTPLHAVAQLCDAAALRNMLDHMRLDGPARERLMMTNDARGRSMIDVAASYVGQYGEAPGLRPAVEAQAAEFLDVMVQRSERPIQMLRHMLAKIPADVFAKLFRLYADAKQKRNAFLMSLDGARHPPVLSALAVRNLEAAEFLAMQGANILHVTRHGQTALHVWLTAWENRDGQRAEARMLAGVRRLLEYAGSLADDARAAWVTQQGNMELSDGRILNHPTPLHLACLYQCHDVVPLLLAHGADCLVRSNPGHTVLEMAALGAIRGSERGRRTLEALWHGLSATGQWAALVNAPNFEGMTTLRLLVQRLEHCTGKDKQAIQGVIDFLRGKGAKELPAMPYSAQELLSLDAFPFWGAVPPARPPASATLLHQAVALCNLHTLKMLLNAGDLSIDKTDDTGRSPLMHAVQNGREEVVKLLLRYRPNASVTDPFGLTALHFAAQAGHVGIVRALIRYDASIIELVGGRTLRIGSTGGLTALHFACGGDHVDVVKLLLTSGAQATAFCNLRGNVLHMAARRGAVKVIEYLFRRHADDMRPLLTQQTGEGLTPVDAALQALSNGKSPARAEGITAAIAMLQATGEPPAPVTGRHARDDGSDDPCQLPRSSAKKQKT